MVAATGIGLGAAGLLAAMMMPFGVEGLKKPRLEIKPIPWQPKGPIYPMTFASAQVYNRPIRGPLGKPLDRAAAEACEISIDFFTWGDRVSTQRVFDTIPGRWDSHPQPLELREVERHDDRPSGRPPVQSRGTVSPGVSTMPAGEVLGAEYNVHAGWFDLPATTGWRLEYNPSAVRKQEDLPVGSDRGGISVAILRDEQAFAFTDESYRYGDLCNPNWQLTMNTTYRVEVRVQGSNADHKQAFKLEFYGTDFGKFRLQTVN